MTHMLSTASSLLLFLGLLIVPTPPSPAAPDQEARRQQLLDVLLSQQMKDHLTNFETKHNERYRWEYYTACLARGVKLAEANDYFAMHKDIGAALPEWRQMELTRTYLAFRNRGLSDAARRNIERFLKKYKQHLDDPEAGHAGKWHDRGNHSIVNYASFLLLDQEGFGHASELRKSYFRNKFLDWVQHQGKYGHDEVNSPHYKERSMNPLLNMVDFIKDATLKRWAQIALDHMLADWALMSLDNSRGGPWRRALQNINPTRDWVDNEQDGLCPAGYLFFGGRNAPDYHWGNCVQSWAFVVTTTYRRPQVLVNIAHKTEPYVYRGHRTRVFSEEGERIQDPACAEWDLYYYVTPSFILASVQDWVYVDNYYPRRTLAGKERDWVNTQVWELTFSHPRKILAAKRDLTTSIERDCPNGSLMQYRNVLFCKGDFLDCNGNLASEGGECVREEGPGKTFHFWRIKTPEGDVYAAAIDFPEQNAGILEVRSALEYGGSFQGFRSDVKDNRSAVKSDGGDVAYTSTYGDAITYKNSAKEQNRGSAKVNGQVFDLHGYPLHDSPYCSSKLGSGVIKYQKDGGNLELRFNDRNYPFHDYHRDRRERGSGK